MALLFLGLICMIPTILILFCLDFGALGGSIALIIVGAKFKNNTKLTWGIVLAGLDMVGWVITTVVSIGVFSTLSDLLYSYS